MELPEIIKNTPKCLLGKQEELDDAKLLLNLLKMNALFNIAKVLKSFEASSKAGESDWDKFNNHHQVELVKMAFSHSYYMMANLWYK